MIKFPSFKAKSFAIVFLAILLVISAPASLHAKPEFPGLDCGRLLDLLSANGWEIELSESGDILLMPPGQSRTTDANEVSREKQILVYSAPVSENKLLNYAALKTILESNGWRVEKGQDGTLFLYFGTRHTVTASNNKEETPSTFTFNQLSALKKKLTETGWHVEQEDGDLFLFPKISATPSAPQGDEKSQNRIAINAPAIIPAALSKTPAAKSDPEPAPTINDADKDGIADKLDLCPETEHETTVNALGCDKSKPLILEGVSFKSGSAELTAAAKAILGRQAITLNQHQDIEFTILGHTDSVGSKRLNLALSKRRAESVQDYLISQEIDKHRILAEGRGEKEPIAENDTAGGRLKNRRVELTL